MKQKRDRKEYYKNYYNLHKEKKREYSKIYYYKNIEKKSNYHKLGLKDNNMYMKHWRELNKDKIKKYSKNKEKARIYSRLSYIKNREKILIRKREYKKNNKDKIRLGRNKYKSKKYNSDCMFKLNQCFSSLIYKSIKKNKNGYKGELLVGYTLQELKIHLEKQFDSNMSGENYGKYGVIDHIKPRSLFHYNTYTDKEFNDCWC